MSAPVTCPSCGRECQVPDQPDAEVKCQDCGRVLGAPTVTLNPPPAADKLDAVLPAPLTTAPAPAPSPVVEATRPSAEEDLMPCPHCGEHILRNSTFCRFCREHVEEEIPPWERGRRVRRDVEPHRGNLILVLGILGFVVPLAGLFLAIAAWVMGRRDMARMDRREMDPSGKGTTQAGFICGIVATVLQGLALLGCVAYIVLIFLILSVVSSATRVPARPMPAGPPPVPPPPPPGPGAVWRMPGGGLRLQDYLPRR
jgi:hypothetical protein